MDLCNPENLRAELLALIKLAQDPNISSEQRQAIMLQIQKTQAVLFDTGRL